MTAKVTDLQTQLEELQEKYQHRLEQEESTKDSVSRLGVSSPGSGKCGHFHGLPLTHTPPAPATHSAHLIPGPLRTQVPFSVNAIKTKCSDLVLSAVVEFKSRLP